MPIDLTGHRKLIALGVLVIIGFLCVLFSLIFFILSIVMVANPGDRGCDDQSLQ